MAGGVANVVARHHYDVATVATAVTHSAVRTFASPQQPLFGADYPLLPIDATDNALKNMGLSTDELKILSHRNPLRLFRASPATDTGCGVRIAAKRPTTSETGRRSSQRLVVGTDFRC
ncbi:hypothetical protein [Mycolicibacterium litorale]|uniref:hypothetical protein n=1 Tax=Mycolicibacterium litorale TaxID=758802 RepID=UPI00399F1A78